MKNILISYPSIGELGDIVDPSNIVSCKQTYKCIYKMFEKKISIDKILLFYIDKDKNNNINIISDEHKVIFANSIKILKQYFNDDSSCEIEYIPTNGEIRYNFEMLTKLISSKDHGEDAIYYINTLSGHKNIKKILYPIVFFNDNTFMLEPEYKIDENTKPKQKTVYCEQNYESMMFKDISNANKYVESLFYDISIDRTKKNILNKNIKINKKFILDRKNIVDFGGVYDVTKKFTEIKKSIQDYNYSYAYEQLDDGNKYKKKLKELYYDSIGAYDIASDYFDGYKAFEILLCKKQCKEAINEIENILNPDFYIMDKSTYESNDIISIIHHSISNGNSDSLLNNLNIDIDSIINEELQNNLQLELVYKFKLLNFNKEYIIKNYSDIDFFEKKQLVDEVSIVATLLHSTVTMSKNLNTMISPKIKIHKSDAILKVYDKVADYINNEMSKFKRLNILLKIIDQYNDSKIKFNSVDLYNLNNQSLYNLCKSLKLYKMYNIIYKYQRSKKSINLLQRQVVTRNYYLNVLHDFKESDTLNLFDKLYNCSCVKFEEIDEFLKHEGINIDLESYLFAVIYNSNNKTKNKVLKHLIKVIDTKDMFRQIRNPFTHSSQDTNLYKIDYNESKDTVVEYLSKNHIKDDSNSLYNYLNLIDKTFFNYYKINGVKYIDYVNNEIISNIYPTINIKDKSKIIKKDSLNACLISIFTEKEPYFFGCYSPTLHILLDNKVNDVYYLVTDEYKDSNVLINAKPKILSEIKKIDSNIKVHFSYISDYSEEKNGFSYEADHCFKTILNFYNKEIEQNYDRILLNGTSSIPTLVNSLSLLQFLCDDVIVFDCSQDYQYYLKLFESYDKRNFNFPDRSSSSNRPMPIITRMKDSVSFANLINMHRSSIDKYDFNTMYYNLGNSNILSIDCKNALKNLNNWTNGNFDTLKCENMILNDERYINIFCNSYYYLKRSNYEFAALTSGFIIEDFVKRMYKVIVDEKLFDSKLIKQNYELHNIYYINSDDFTFSLIQKLNQFKNKDKYKILINTSEFVYTRDDNKKQNIEEIDITTTMYWFFFFGVAINNSRKPNVLTKIGINRLVDIYNLYIIRNSLIHRDATNYSYSGRIDSELVKKGYDALGYYFKVINKQDKIDKIHELYEKQRNIIKEEVGDLNGR